MTGTVDLMQVGGLALGRYRLVSFLAQGGMGVVYLGRVEGAAGFSKPVVIKRVLGELVDKSDINARFIREAQILSHLQHPGIVGVMDFGHEDAGYAMILEYVHGYDLGKWLKYLAQTGSELGWEEAVYITIKVLEALAYAHNFCRSDGTPAGVLHRDISPGNILLDLEGQVRLADFGIARMGEADPGVYKTREGVVTGKLAYLAPELFRSVSPSVGSDVYACAVVLYQMLTGQNPFVGGDDKNVILRVLRADSTPLGDVRFDLPRSLEYAVAGAMSVTARSGPPTPKLLPKSSGRR